MIKLLLAAAVAMVQMPQSQTMNSLHYLTLADAAPGVTIYYTTNGKPPTIASNIYRHPINLNQTVTVSAMAVDVKTGEHSPVASATYTFVALPPVITASNRVVTITADPAVDIFFTTAGNLPTTSAARYSGPFTVAAGTTVHAIAAQTGWTTSSVTSLKVAQ